MILVLDNYDSFVYNLARYIQELGRSTRIYRSDKISLSDIEEIAPKAIIISPGPCTPNEAGVSLDVVKTFGSRIPILGICLGHQTIGQAFGGTVEKAICPAHGKARQVYHDGSGIFKNIQSPLVVGRYHSLIVSEKDLPSGLKVTSYSDEGEIMSLQHTTYPVFGLQFHPESVLTERGYDLLNNFLNTISKSDEKI